MSRPPTVIQPESGSASRTSKDSSVDFPLPDGPVPRLDGLSVLADLRRRRARLPVIILTARNTPDDLVASLDGGADDYMSKPFRLAELLAWVRARLRPGPAPEEFVLRNGDLGLDLRTRQAQAAGQTVDLSAREFALAEMFLRHPGQVLSRDQLLSHVWG